MNHAGSVSNCKHSNLKKVGNPLIQLPNPLSIKSLAQVNRKSGANLNDVNGLF